MKAIKLISIGIVLLAIFMIVFRLCVIKIHPGQSGVLTKEWGSGLQEEDIDRSCSRIFL